MDYLIDRTLTSSSTKEPNIFSRDYLSKLTETKFDDDYLSNGENVEFNDENYFQKKRKNRDLGDYDFLSKRQKTDDCLRGDDIVLTNKITDKLLDEEFATYDQSGFQIKTNLFKNLDEIMNKSKELYEDDLFYSQKLDAESFEKLNLITDFGHYEQSGGSMITDDLEDEFYQLDSMKDELVFERSNANADERSYHRLNLIGSKDEASFKVLHSITNDDEENYNRLNSITDHDPMLEESEIERSVLIGASRLSSEKDEIVNLHADLALSDDETDDQQLNDKRIVKETDDQLLNDKRSLKDIYKAEKLLAKRYKKNGRLEYLVKYENLDDDQLFWESERTLDPTLVVEFNCKYGDRLLLEDIDKRTYSMYFDKRIGGDKTASVDPDALIRSSIGNPLCDVYKSVKPERIIGLYKFDDKYFYLIKWDKLVKADLYECESFKARFPEVVLDYYERKMMFCDLEEKHESDAIVSSKRVSLNKMNDVDK